MSAKKRGKQRPETTRLGTVSETGVKTPSGLTRSAADRARASELRAVRVDHIVKLMTSGAWKGARTHRSLAAKWEVSFHSVADYAREASATIRRAVSGDLDTIKTEILLGIQATRRVAEKLVKYVRTGEKDFDPMPAPNVDAMLRSYELQAKLLGILVEKRQDVPSLEGLTREQHLAELARLEAEIAEEKQRLVEAERGTLQ